MMERSLLIHPEELDAVWISELKRLGIHGLGLHPVGGKRAHETLQAMLERFRDKNYRALLDKASENDISVTFEMHALRNMMPLDVLIRNPTWQRVNLKGERMPDVNFCPSSPDALEYLSHSAAKLYARLPGRPKRTAFWLDDAQDAFCHCPACAALSPSDQQMIILGAILNGIRTVRADANLAYLAYFETLPTPDNTYPKDGIYLQFAPYRRLLYRPLNDPACEENRREISSIRPLVEYFGTKDATALDYWYDNSLQSNYRKPPRQLTALSEVVRKDLAFYAQLGFERVSSFACYLGADYRALWGLPDLSAFGE